MNVRTTPRDPRARATRCADLGRRAALIRVRRWAFCWSTVIRAPHKQAKAALPHQACQRGKPGLPVDDGDGLDLDEQVRESQAYDLYGRAGRKVVAKVLFAG